MFNVEKIRKDFEVLNKNIVYLDSACMSLKPRQVIDKINEYYKEYPGCGGRSHHKISKQVTLEVENSRKIIKKFLNAKKGDLIFTKNTTESINLVANSLGFNKGDIVVSSDREHNSNLLPWQMLEERKGIKRKIVDGKQDFSFDLEDYKEKIKGAKLVSVVHVSNLDGYTLPIKEIIKIAHENDALVMIDGAQSAPHKEIDVKKLDADFFAFSGHKMLGPTAIGGLYGKQELLEKLDPFIVGGETVNETTYDSHEFDKIPHKFEAGLQHYAGIVGFGAATNYLMKAGLKNIEKHEMQLQKFIVEELNDSFKIKRIGFEGNTGIFNFNIENMSPHNVAMILDETDNIMIRSGAHCVHSWFNKHNLQGSARASLYLYNNKEDCERFIKGLRKVLKLG